jgi:hypothetical protein
MLRVVLFLGGVACSVALVGCFSDGTLRRDGGVEGDPWSVAPTPPGEAPGGTSSPLPAITIADGSSVAALQPVAITELASLFDESAKLVGVTFAGSSAGRARLYVLEANQGLYEVTDQAARLVFDVRSSRVRGGTGDGSPPFELTDVAFDPVHSDGDLGLGFALTAENEGFLLSLPDGTLTAHFCYLPDLGTWETTQVPSVSQELRDQGIAVAERTEAVAINEITGQIFAQPRTFRMDSAGVAGSELFVFGVDGGQPIGTRRFESGDFVAGGASLRLPTTLVLGSGDSLYATSGWADDIRRVVTSSELRGITGMTNTPDGNLLVLDGPTQRLLEFDAAQVDAAINGR